ncbi:MAG: heavy-metal-associated domain-containing protein [Oscillospiraceae bacterium]|nr:heavy-metal-associated domain-containing protein [Oscillospiraceae bacterium]
MTTTLKIEGMKCEHCAARAKKFLLAVQGVSEAAVSAAEANAVVTHDDTVSCEALAAAVKEAGYTVVG